MTTLKQLTTSHGYISMLILWLAWTQSSVAANTLPVGIFVDEYCKYASPLNPNFDSPLNTCIVTPGAWGIKPSSLVCEDGTPVRLIWYMSAGCSDDGVRGSPGYCSSNYPSVLAGYVAFCGAEQQLQITSTTTIAVATNIISVTSTANTKTSSRPTNSATTQASEATNSSSSSGDKPSGWAGLSNGERIGAIIALSIGIPSIIISLVICIRRR